MKKLLLLMVAALAFAVTTSGQSTPTPMPKPASAPAPAPLALKVGDVAPDFTLTDTTGAKVKLSDFRGKSNVVLAFYIFAFTGG